MIEITPIRLPLPTRVLEAIDEERGEEPRTRWIIKTLILATGKPELFDDIRPAHRPRKS